VCALGHYLEEEGIATVAVGLIRPQIENTRPPRALWVPFELGRPFGPPNDPMFQKDVILAALHMLERGCGPVTLEDFPHDDPRERSDPVWRPPFAKTPTGADGDAIADALDREIVRLDAAYRRSVAERGRTTLGLSGLSVDEIGGYIGAWLRAKNPASPSPDMSAPLTLRFAVDDLKAYCLEAALAGPAKPSSKQLADWLWNETAAGAAILALRRAYREADDDRLKLIAGNFLVPNLRVPPGG
jgi:hypothetical protein